MQKSKSFRKGIRKHQLIKRVLNDHNKRMGFMWHLKYDYLKKHKQVIRIGGLSPTQSDIENFIKTIAQPPQVAEPVEPQPNLPHA